MLNIHSFTFNAFSENTYLIVNENKECWIIDPGMYHPAEKEELINFINERELIPQAIINTHAHLDHIFGVQALIDKYNIPFGVHRLETSVLDSGTKSAAMFGFDFPDVPKPTFFIKEGTPFTLGNDAVAIFHTPGHSPGSISFYYAPGNWVLSGDVLFEGSIGRTDLPGGNFETLINSIRTHLLTLPGETTVYPGHGPSTTISEERSHNPFLK